MEGGAIPASTGKSLWHHNGQLEFALLKVDTRRKFTTSANYGQIIYGWKDFPLIYTNNVLRIHINLLEIRKMSFSNTLLRLPNRADQRVERARNCDVTSWAHVCTVIELRAKCLLFSLPFLNCYRSFTAIVYNVSPVVNFPVICEEFSFWF